MMMINMTMLSMLLMIIMMQLEGFSCWRIMNLNKKQKSLPTDSESNISSKDISAQWDTPTIDCKLSPGDSYCFPWKAGLLGAPER